MEGPVGPAPGSRPASAARSVPAGPGGERPRGVPEGDAEMVAIESAGVLEMTGTGESAESDPTPLLLEEVRRGSRAAFERLYRLHAGWVYALCLRLTADRDEAEALTQDTFVRMWQKLHTYSGSGPFGGWLRRVAVNVVIDSRRGRARRERLFEEGEDAVARASVAPLRIEEAIDLERAIERLPRGARYAFVLHDIEGYRHDEIAEVFGIATGTVKAQLHRARRLLRETLAGSQEVGLS